MVDKVFVKVSNPIDKTSYVDAELIDIKNKEESPNVYRLVDGTVIYLYLDVDKISIPIDPKTGKYFKDNAGQTIYSVNPHIRMVVARETKR
jgi:hypothetical protein